MPTFTYSGDPSSTPVDAVRFLLGDVLTPWLFSNEEITYMLGQNGSSKNLAAAKLARAQAARWSAKGVATFDGITLDYVARARAMNIMADKLESEAAEEGDGVGIPYAGGISLSDNATIDANTDRPSSIVAELDYPS